MSVDSILNKPPQYPGTGRPTKLTPEVQTTICKTIAAGNYLVTACRAARIDDVTMRSWIERGQAELDAGTPGIFSGFLAAVKEAEAQAEIQLVADVKIHTNRNVVAPLALLDRRFRERWGQTPANSQGGGNTYNINIEKAIIDAAGKFDTVMRQRADREATLLAVPDGAETGVTPGTEPESTIIEGETDE